MEHSWFWEQTKQIIYFVTQISSYWLYSTAFCIAHAPLDNASNYQVKGTTIVSEINSSDISFPLNRKGSCKPLETLWRSTMGIQPPSTLSTLPNAPVSEGGLSPPRQPLDEWSRLGRKSYLCMSREHEERFNIRCIWTSFFLLFLLQLSVQFLLRYRTLNCHWRLNVRLTRFFNQKSEGFVPYTMPSTSRRSSHCSPTAWAFHWEWSDKR